MAICQALNGLLLVRRFGFVGANGGPSIGNNGESGKIDKLTNSKTIFVGATNRDQSSQRPAVNSSQSNQGPALNPDQSIEGTAINRDQSSGRTPTDRDRSSPEPSESSMPLNQSVNLRFANVKADHEGDNDSEDESDPSNSGYHHRQAYAKSQRELLTPDLRAGHIDPYRNGSLWIRPRNPIFVMIDGLATGKTPTALDLNQPDLLLIIPHLLLKMFNQDLILRCSGPLCSEKAFNDRGEMKFKGRLLMLSALLVASETKPQPGLRLAAKYLACVPPISSHASTGVTFAGESNMPIVRNVGLSQLSSTVTPASDIKPS